MHSPAINPVKSHLALVRPSFIDNIDFIHGLSSRAYFLKDLL